MSLLPVSHGYEDVLVTLDYDSSFFSSISILEIYGLKVGEKHEHPRFNYFLFLSNLAVTYLHWSHELCLRATRTRYLFGLFIARRLRLLL